MSSVPLDAATACLGALAIGAAVDDTIHQVVRYRDGLAAGRDVEDAIRCAPGEVVPALVYTTIAISIGFLVLGLSEFTLVENFGVITCFLVVICLLADLTLLPALLVMVGRPRSRVGTDSVSSLPERIA